jgi:Zn-dependent protease/CBS domain-containing protein
MNQPGVFRLARVAGIDVKIHWSLLIIVGLFVFMFATSTFPARVPGETPIFYWTLGIVGSVIFFLSVLIHEFSHSLVAQRLGYKVSDIVLFIFGGASNIESEPKRARDEFAIAFVGPASSVVLGAVFWLLDYALSGVSGRVVMGARALFEYMALINVLLAVFNMIPGFPLDGGRVLRAVIWGLTKNFRSATRVSAIVGQVVAYGFIFLGIVQTFWLGDLSGLWLAFIGWFLLNAAQQSATSVVVRDAVRGVTVGQLMRPAPPPIYATGTLAHLLSNYILPYNLRAVPVVDPEGRLAGIITLGDIKDVPQEGWGTVTVGDKMTGPDDLRVVNVTDPLARAVEQLGEGDFDQLPVVDAYGRLAGMLTRADLMRFLNAVNRAQPGARSAGEAPPV